MLSKVCRLIYIIYATYDIKPFKKIKIQKLQVGFKTPETFKRNQYSSEKVKQQVNHAVSNLEI